MGDAETTEQTVSLLEQIKRVAEARQSKEALKWEKEASLTQWEADNAGLLNHLKDIADACQQEEELLRELTIKVYQETGSKAPAPGVAIKIFTSLEYDPKEALEWAMQHQIALSLDKKSFEGFAKATPIPFVTVTEEPRAQIATDLSAALKGE